MEFRLPDENVIFGVDEWFEKVYYVENYTKKMVRLNMREEVRFVVIDERVKPPVIETPKIIYDYPTAYPTERFNSKFNEIMNLVGSIDPKILFNMIKSFVDEVSNYVIDEKKLLEIIKMNTNSKDLFVKRPGNKSGDIIVEGVGDYGEFKVVIGRFEYSSKYDGEFGDITVYFDPKDITIEYIKDVPETVFDIDDNCYNTCIEICQDDCIENCNGDEDCEDQCFDFCEDDCMSRC